MHRIFMASQQDSVAESSQTRNWQTLLESSRFDWQRVTLDSRADEATMLSQLQRELSFQGEISSLIIGGYSLGARLALTLVPVMRPRAAICIGYPFHRRGDPKDTHGLSLLLQAKIPVLILQGERDAYGSWQEVRSYGALPPLVRLHWLKNANHQLLSRGGKGIDEAEVLIDAREAIAKFLDETHD